MDVTLNTHKSKTSIVDCTQWVSVNTTIHYLRNHEMKENHKIARHVEMKYLESSFKETGLRLLNSSVSSWESCPGLGLDKKGED